ncbi:MAG: carboxymuconolactone decarboxylase family protein [Tannerella sp.]|jgi:AhpD family alkylhydroperoxidase|nr:carboxymuconolactone decarboxylase family protein [Tannerella sp.]
MENVAKEQIEQIIKLRKQAHTFYLEKSKVYRSFVKMEEATFEDNALSKLQKELIAVGISIVINCESCMEWHIKQALDCGATESEILEAIEVGIEMGGGPATVSARFAMNVLAYYQEQTDTRI